APPVPLRRMVDTVSDYAIFAIDTEGTVMNWNRDAERLKGYAAPEIVGRSFKLFYPREAVAAAVPGLELQAAAREGRCESEGWRIRKDGSRFWARGVLTALYDQGGKLIGFTRIASDAT